MKILLPNGRPLAASITAVAFVIAAALAVILAASTTAKAQATTPETTEIWVADQGTNKTIFSRPLVR